MSIWYQFKTNSDEMKRPKPLKTAHFANRKFKCPECSKNKAVPEFMNNDGYTKSPLARQIIDIKEYLFRRQLPIIAQAEFPAFLTKKSGISRDLPDLIRPLMQSSTGPLRLSNILQELHTKRYDMLQYQYLANYKHRVDNPGLRPLPVPAPEFSKFNGKYGYNGYYPSAKYISFVYTSLIGVYRTHLDHQIMKVDGTILKGDHTFKAASNIGSLSHGVNVFDALYTVTNEYEEIRLQSFVPTKSPVHLIGSFDKMYDADNMYGYTLPKPFYTDNVRSDRNFLEEHLPSLLENVQHVDGLPVAAIPSNVEIFVNKTQCKKSMTLVIESCETIMIFQYLSTSRDVPVMDAVLPGYHLQLLTLRFLYSK
ncbi:hypothetical protein [Parasitella parasitica]|uniref:Uncharacterized protein n=1 Tax=Parasitella parasitica TaxID=35722 RepID=A0A0B7NID6_9FUNG|nr:hypothetical protein [Parasitella parasitica]